MEQKNIKLTSKHQKNKYIYVCTWCSKSFSKQSNLSRHTKNVHGSSVAGRKKTICCPLCKTLVGFYTELDTHLESEHSISIIKKNHTVLNTKDFQNWKNQVEAETKSCFRFLNSIMKESKKITKYVCHRSGNCNIKEKNRQRAIKVKGSNKINVHCPARIIATETLGQVAIQYFETHIGHTQDVGSLRLSKNEREGIAAKLFHGISHQRILKDIGQKFDPFKRLSYTTNHDIHNIKNSFNIQSDVIFHKDDAASVDILVNKLKPLFEDSEDNPILAYKPYGVNDSTVGTDNFFLVFMNTAQQDLLNLYGNDILMIDSTHGTNPYKIQLTTLMVADKNCEGFPVAFLWSISQTEQIFIEFFECIKKKVPNISPNNFMSDDTNTFYNAFTKVFLLFPKKILCDWHVKKNLFENMSKISIGEKKKEVKANLKAIINETDISTFEKCLPTFIQKLIQDPDTQKYGLYFFKYYGNRPEQWAHCYKKGSHRNTNMALEKWHQEIKHNTTVGGKCQQRLDASIANVLECLRVKFMKRLVYISRNKVPHKLHLLRKRHKVAVEFLNETVVEKETSNIFLVASSKNTNSKSLLEYYTVTFQYLEEKCNCLLFCTECKFCLHTYSCTCHDYAVQYNMCKHIHLVGISFFKNSDDESLNCNGILMENENNNDNDLNENNAISKYLFNKDTQNNLNNLETKKKSVIEELSTLITNISKCQSYEALLYVSKNIQTIKSGMNAIECHILDSIVPETKYSHNKKIEHQKRYFAPLKKVKSTKHKTKLPDDDPRSVLLTLTLPS